MSLVHDRTIRKLDIAQVSLNLQDRLGLAKVRYQRTQLRGADGKNDDDGQSSLPSDSRPSDWSSDLGYSRSETPLTSPIRSASFSTELPRSAKNKHAVMFNSEVMQPMLNASRKRVRSNSITERPTKLPKMSWKSAHDLPASSPGFSRHMPIYSNHPPTVDSSSSVHVTSDEENDPEPPPSSYGEVSSSMISSSPPRTPPPKPARLARIDKDIDAENSGADLLLYLANSPTPARNNSKQTPHPPSTPPSRYAGPSLTPTPGGGLFNFGTPKEQFNLSDYVNVTPSPAQRQLSSRTPGNLSKTPLLRSARKSLNFDNLMPPGLESPTERRSSGLPLELGEELRP
ncbi:hypothetical protein VTN49DRAFT_5374 [Thermomyces lanuginosus]|uniref:uncharacterized protein n=1 Tax=Thermomyces lanuginosus TaxID=5541 RepID=UPI0037423C00